jgi:hypothetical protein
MDNQALRDYFKFDDVDLNANRSGKLSEKQQKKLAEKNTSSQKWGLGLGLGGGVLFFGIASIFPLVFIPMAVTAWQQHNTGTALGILIAPLFWVLIWGGIGCVLIYIGFRSAVRDRSKFLLKSVSGPINIVGVEVQGEHGHTSIAHELHIAKEEFDVDEELGGLMMQGDVYAVYFIENMDGSDENVLSLEWLSKG